jgi:hypothetical protein
VVESTVSQENHTKEKKKIERDEIDVEISESRGYLHDGEEGWRERNVYIYASRSGVVLLILSSDVQTANTTTQICTHPRFEPELTLEFPQRTISHHPTLPGIFLEQSDGNEERRQGNRPLVPLCRCRHRGRDFHGRVGSFLSTPHTNALTYRTMRTGGYRSSTTRARSSSKSTSSP